MITSKAIVIGLACKSAQVGRNTLKSCTLPDRTIQDHSRIGTPGLNEGVFSPIRSNNSSFSKWTGNIEPLETSVDESATQERNSDFSCIEKVGVKSLPDNIFAGLDPIIQVNLANSVLSESPKFKNLGILTLDITGTHNIDFAPSNRAKSLNGMRRDNFRYAMAGEYT